MPHPAPQGWYPRRGEVYLVRLLGGKTRPALILSADLLNKYALDVCVVPLTTVQRGDFSLRIPVRPPEGGLERDSWAKGDQVHTVEKRDLLHPPLGRIAQPTLRRIEEAVRAALQL